MYNARNLRLMAYARYNWLRGIVNLNERKTLNSLFKHISITDRFIISTIQLLQSEFKDIIWKKRNLTQKLKEASNGRNIKKAFKQIKAATTTTINKASQKIKKVIRRLPRFKKSKPLPTSLNITHNIFKPELDTQC